MIPYLGVLLTFYFHLTNGFQCAPPLIEGFSPKYCYQIVKEQQVSWFAADYGCRQLGGSLATIDSAVLNALLVGAADEVFSQGTTFWIGYTNVYYPPQWLWNDGQNSSYNNWAPNQLNGSGTFCASVQTPDRKWYSYDCSVTKPYVCEIPIVVQPTCPPIPTEVAQTTCPPIPPEVTPTTCPPIESCGTAEPQVQSPCPTGDDWVYLKLFNKCYLYIHTQQYQNWDVSRAECQKRGGDMVSIGSYEENSVVGGIGMQLEINVGEANVTDIRAKMWLGLYKNGNSWYWANGAPLKYTNWAPGEPGLDNYGVIGYGTDNQFHWFAIDAPNTISICETNPNV